MLLKNSASGLFLARTYYFCRTLTHRIKIYSMENIENKRGKGYCILYLFMGLLFFTLFALMLYNRSFILDFTR